MSDAQIVPVNHSPDAAILAQGGFGLNQASLKPETIIMVQPSTKGLPKGTAPGTFFDKSSGDTWETMKIVPISLHKVRDKYPTRAYNPTDKPTCRSRDGLVPIKDSKFLVAEAPNCQVCEFSKWNNDLPKGHPESKPFCKEAYLLTFIDFETKLPFRIKLSGTSVAVGKALEDALNRKAIMANARAPKGTPPASLFDFVVEMAAEQKSGVTTYTVSFPRIQQMVPEKVAEFGPIYLELLRQREAAKAAREAAKNSQAVNEATGEVLEPEYDEDTPVDV